MLIFAPNKGSLCPCSQARTSDGQRPGLDLIYVMLKSATVDSGMWSLLSANWYREVDFCNYCHVGCCFHFRVLFRTV
jgi:hypothetical protein